MNTIEKTKKYHSFEIGKMRSYGRKSISAYTIESLLDRIACLDPTGLSHQEAIEDDYNKKRYSSDSRSKRNGGGSVGKNNSRHRLSRSQGRPVSTPRPSMRGSSSKGRLQVCEYTPTATSTLNTASESDATPWSRSKKSWSTDNISSSDCSSHSSSESSSHSSDSHESSVSSEESDYDDKINLVIQVKRDCEDEQTKQPAKPKRRPEVSPPPKKAPVQPAVPRTSRKSFFLRSQPKPVKSQQDSVKSQRRSVTSQHRSKDPETNSLKHKELWTGKTVNASRRVGPF